MRTSTCTIKTALRVRSIHTHTGVKTLALSDGLQSNTSLLSLPDISHTRGPLDGSLYAQVKKRRGPGSTASAASPNGCLTNSPTVKPQAPSHPQSLTCTTESNRSSFPSEKLQDVSLSKSPERETAECPSKRGDGEIGEKEKTKGKERDRETAILDDTDPSSPGALRRDNSCCGRMGAKCGDVGWKREQEPCLSNGRCLGHCSSIKKHPKSQTLPALPSKSMSPPPHPAHLELCHRHSAHPLPELPWERPLPPPPPALPCVLRPCYPCPTSEHIHPHSHTLPALNRVCTGDECNLFHYSSHSPSPHLSHQSLPTSPYREMFFNSQTSSPACPCRECFSRREHQSSSVRTFHPLHPDQLESQHWSLGGGLHQTREAPRLWESENQWEAVREAEIWNCKPAVPAFHLCHPTAGQGPSPEHPRYTIGVHQSYPGPLMEVQDRASSGYHTPPQPRHSCPCSSYQSSPAESHESRGYASGYQSGSASPLPAGSPSPERGRPRQTPSLAKDQLQTEQHKGNCEILFVACQISFLKHNAISFSFMSLLKEEKVAADVVDKISQGSESKSESNDQSSSPGPDSDHDYTVIGSNSPTHTEER